MNGWALNGRKTKIFLAVFLIGVPATAFYGGGYRSNGYVGPLPSSYFSGEPCFTSTVSKRVELGLTEVAVNPRGVAEDGNAKTYLRCQDFANFNQLLCTAGFADGTIATCNDPDGPRVLPGPDDRVYMVIDTSVTNPSVQNCDITVESNYGEANPACRAGGGGGSGGSGGGGSSTCNATTAVATLNHGQSTTVASNACVRLKVEPTWSTINPQMQAQPGTASYPVPYSYASCAGTGSGSLTGNWVTSYLIDGNSGMSPNINCDIYVQLQGGGSAVQFAYYD